MDIVFSLTGNSDTSTYVHAGVDRSGDQRAPGIEGFGIADAFGKNITSFLSRRATDVAVWWCEHVTVLRLPHNGAFQYALRSRAVKHARLRLGWGYKPRDLYILAHSEYLSSTVQVKCGIVYILVYYWGI